jgi:hypothetical protein
LIAPTPFSALIVPSGLNVTFDMFVDGLAKCGVLVTLKHCFPSVTKTSLLVMLLLAKMTANPVSTTNLGSLILSPHETVAFNQREFCTS